MSDGLKQAQEKMRAAGVADEAITVFSHYYGELESGATGMIPEDSIDPVAEPTLIADVEIGEEEQRAAFARTAIIKLNGGLGTSMGMDKAKSLLPVRDGQSFLDLIVTQVRAAREQWGVDLPLLFMNSFRTSEDTLAALSGYDGLEVGGLGLEFVQNQEPKLRADDLAPVEWPADPTLEWCPPGHGDLYTALAASGVLERLLAAGYRYASVSNSDNLGAAPNPKIAAWFAASGAPYAAELCRRTPADVKGGHLAIRKSDGRLILRETAQTPKEDMHYFTDESRHPYFHTNNLWFDLEVLDATLKERHAVLGLPLIKNEKTVDPADSSSPAVIQLESAMGAAVEVFEGATCLGVGRERFLPVKTTNDLLLLRSDVYEVGGDGRLTRVADPAPLIDLDPSFYKTIGKFEQRFPAGAPSLKRAKSLTVRGDWTFERGVVVEGAGELPDQGSPEVVATGALISG
ncbi:UTP--glucose-1-phosphate uridylyltransferase [Friedmanniella endophytica]|uniref:UTP--glucose-1-phosphate uridylyltransferase n=1 Tax=Microlunatus kandeliicorticis TaxID=1759536 RepID=A0A7W3P665_9ACTN|nr:UTP--glucose-1-phosphate uridylyltransferase [Microlunatus kandeliicorticis]MBA8794653.1 UTP--glucose-1-phosphate uridylyltransferase [Microlunatus kandeliicorticis]